MPQNKIIVVEISRIDLKKKHIATEFFPFE
jgi:hypothetical protein